MSTRVLGMTAAPASRAALAETWYVEGVATTPAGLVYATDGTDVIYTNAPENAVLCYTDSSGVRRRDPADSEPTPSRIVILALPGTGLTAADVNLRLYRNGAAQPQPTMTSLGSGDHAVAMPVLTEGVWSLRADYYYMAFTVEVVVAAAEAVLAGAQRGGMPRRLAATMARLSRATTGTNSQLLTTFSQPATLINLTDSQPTAALNAAAASGATLLSIKDPGGAGLVGKAPKYTTVRVAGVDYTLDQEVDLGPEAATTTTLQLATGLLADAAEDDAVALSGGWTVADVPSLRLAGFRSDQLDANRARAAEGGRYTQVKIAVAVGYAEPAVPDGWRPVPSEMTMQVGADIDTIQYVREGNVRWEIAA